MANSWNQIRLNAAEFSREWATATYERGEAQSFYNDFFEIFGLKRRTVARFEEHLKKLNDRSGFIDLFWPGVLIAEHKSAGEDLDRAESQAGEYFDALPEDKKPRYQLACDFQNFRLLDRERGSSTTFRLAELAEHVEEFAFVLGKEKLSTAPKESVNIGAAKTVSALYVSLQESGFVGDDLERFLVRTVFCFFADSAGIFEPRGIFLDFLQSRTNANGTDLGAQLTALFQVLDTPYGDRAKTLDSDLTQFTYINGDLFSGNLRIPSFSEAMRQQLLEAAEFNWAAISPAIFGSLFQNVLGKEEKRIAGAFYTKETDILKVLKDLFFDEQYAELRSIISEPVNRAARIRLFRKSLSTVKWLDPACGCGNFLSVAYREVRLLDLEAVKSLIQLRLFDASKDELCSIDVDQFFGIEKRAYSIRVAETALWMMDHIANSHLSLEVGKVFARIPLRKSANLIHGDALELDWAKLAVDSTFDFVIGNPPYLGSKKQSENQRKQVARVMQSESGSTSLDYVAGWLVKAAELVHTGSKVGFISTSSVWQGEQIADIWERMSRASGSNLEIFFAHQPFDWSNEAGADAGVHVVAVGLSQTDAGATKKLYRYDDYKVELDTEESTAISPYILPISSNFIQNTVVNSERAPINGFPPITIGSKPVDGGYFILTEEEKISLLSKEPKAADFIHPYIGAKEWLSGTSRFILNLNNASMAEVRQLKEVAEIVSKVRLWREGKICNKAGGKKRKRGDNLAHSPTQYHVTRVPTAPFLAIPEVTSERREYVPIGWLQPPTIPSNLLKIAQGATLTHFGLLTSKMHMAWLRHIGGSLESRFRYSERIVYNTFPVPADMSNNHLDILARKILSVRRSLAPANLEDMYDPALMEPSLREAHSRLDRAVDKLYGGGPFESSEDRAQYLLDLYEKRRNRP
jgi:hypothetical protein